MIWQAQEPLKFKIYVYFAHKSHLLAPKSKNESGELGRHALHHSLWGPGVERNETPSAEEGEAPCRTQTAKHFSTTKMNVFLPDL